MKIQMSLLSLAIASGLVMSGSADAADNQKVSTPNISIQKTAAISRVDALIAGKKADAAIRRASADSFVAKDAIVDADGTEHVRYHRTHEGLPVIGGDFVVHSRNGKLDKVSQTLATTKRPSLTSRINGDEAIVEAGARFELPFSGKPTSRLVIYALGASPVLAHEVVLKGIKADQTPTEMHYFVDASNGKILNKWDTVHNARPGPGGGGSGCVGATAAVGTGKSLTEGDVVLNTIKCGTNYQLVDMTRGGGATHNMTAKTTGMGAVFTGKSNTWGNNLVSNIHSAAADAHYGVAMTWDYFKNAHGREGIANDGKGAISRVHYGVNYGNAFWSGACFCMTFGDGSPDGLPLVALDIAGHEMTHGITERSAGLVYSDDAGGLNEANSDIFGTMVEFYANNSNDPADYVIGEKLYADADNPDLALALRWMFKPSLDGPIYDNQIASFDCYPKEGFAGVDPHFSSGPANRYFYLLAEGAVVPKGFGAGSWANLTKESLVCNGNTALKGIGREAAAKIHYRALTVYMTSGTTYPQARAASIKASTDLYGPTSTQTKAVMAAWSAVNVN